MQLSTLIRIPQTMRNLQRLRQIAAVLVKFGWGNLVPRLGLVGSIERLRRRFTGTAEDEAAEMLTTEQRIRRALEELGPTFIAGNETTTNLIGNATNALLLHREELARVRADRILVPALVEETLRYDSPVQLVFRRSVRDVEIAGTRIPADSYVVVLIGSANRDETQWGPTAASFDVRRDTTGHLAFGLGNHFCLGAALARLEARIVLDEMLDEIARLEHCDQGVEYVDSFLVRGPRSLPLRPAT